LHEICIKFVNDRHYGFKTSKSKYRASVINWQQSSPANPGQEI